MNILNNVDHLCVSFKELAPIFEEQIYQEKSVSFAPKGKSMLPMIREGKDTVTLSAIKVPIKKYDIVFYKRKSGQYVLHRIVRVGKTYTCIGDNQFAYERGIGKEQIIAVVSAFTRNGKEHSVNNFFYGLYCRFWHYSRFLRRCVRAIWRRVSRFFQNNTKN